MGSENLAPRSAVRKTHGKSQVAQPKDARTGAIDLAADVGEFFRDAVGGAVKGSGFDPTPAAELYVAGLLADFARSDQLAEAALERPVTFALQDALRAAGPQRFERLRTLGDGVLYVSGFFGAHLSQRGVPVRYVAAVGSSAYDHAASMLRGGGGSANVLAELATRFDMFVELLADVADRLLAGAARSDRELLRLYERWLATGSTELATALAGHGMTPMRGDGTLN